MAQPTQTIDQGLAKRGLMLLGFLLVLTTAVAFVLFRPKEAPAPTNLGRPDLAAFAVASPGGAFPAMLNWAALGVLADELPSAPGWQVRYNAAITLSRKGSAKLPLDIFAEMLDEKQQGRNFRILLTGGDLAADDVAAQRVVLGAIKALEDWHRQGSAAKLAEPNQAELTRVYAAVGALTHSDSPALREAAKEFEKHRESGKW